MYPILDLAVHKSVSSNSHARPTPPLLAPSTADNIDYTRARTGRRPDDVHRLIIALLNPGPLTDIDEGLTGLIPAGGVPTHGVVNRTGLVGDSIVGKRGWTHAQGHDPGEADHASIQPGGESRCGAVTAARNAELELAQLLRRQRRPFPRRSG
jgi:hypothetical protein